MFGPTRGASDARNAAWASSPILSRVVRVFIFVAPVLATWMAIRLASSWFYRPDGWLGVGLWIAQAIVVATVVGMVVDRLTPRFVPLATLLGMSLAFPDQAPSRFGVALRTGTVGKLQARLDEWQETGLADDEATAARQAVELVTLLGRHERLTRGHTERVRAYADLIATEMGLNEADRQKLAWASLLHDIGKLTVPAEILNKDGRPTDDEWTVLQGHPAAGEAFIAPLAEWLGDWRLATSQHHERWDGKGYPYGLAGTEISLAGRIVSVADAYDVITSKRSYKEPLTAEAARRELVDCAGSHFDPVVVRAMLNVSLNRHRSSAWMAWLLELPGAASVARVVSSMPTAAAASVLALGATAALPPTDAEPPENLAFEGSHFDQDASASALPDPNVIVIPTPTSDAAPQPRAIPTPTPKSGLSGFVIPTPTPGPDGPGVSTPSPAPAPGPGLGPVPQSGTPTPPTATPTQLPTPTPELRNDCAALLGGELQLPGANLVGCDVLGMDLAGVNLAGANLTSADLSGSTIEDFNLDGATLVGADLTQTRLYRGSMIGADAAGIQAPGIRVTHVDLAFADMTGANLKGSRFTQSSFANAVLTDADFADSEFVDSDFNDADISGANFTDAKMSRTQFFRTNALGARFSRADIQHARLDDADFGLVVFDGANARQAVVSNTNLDRASLATATFRQATGLPRSPGTAIYQNTVCPNNTVTDVNCWPP